MILRTSSNVALVDTGVLSSSSTANYTVTGVGGDTSLYVAAASGNGFNTTSVSVTATCTHTSPLGLTSTPSATTKVGASYSQTNVASGGTSSYSYQVFSGTLPAGTSLNPSSGTVSGTPTAAGGFSYVIRATDSTLPTHQTADQPTSVTIAPGTTGTALASSANPSSFGQSVTFTATVTVGGGTPTGTVTFNDGAATSGTGTLSGGSAHFTTSVLALGTHSITASYGGDSNFGGSVSPAVIQAVNVPADSQKLRQLQDAGTKVVAQTSGQAITGAIDEAIDDAFNNGGPAFSPAPAADSSTSLPIRPREDVPKTIASTRCSARRRPKPRRCRVSSATIADRW